MWWNDSEQRTWEKTWGKNERISHARQDYTSKKLLSDQVSQHYRFQEAIIDLKRQAILNNTIDFKLGVSGKSIKYVCNSYKYHLRAKIMFFSDLNEYSCWLQQFESYVCWFVLWKIKKVPSLSTKNEQAKASENMKSGETTLVTWKLEKDTSIILKYETCFRSQRDAIEANEVRCPASHRERPTSLLQNKEHRF